jgi:hypothetical protein
MGFAMLNPSYELRAIQSQGERFFESLGSSEAPARALPPD